MRDALCAIDRNYMGVVLVMDDSDFLLGTITDGDLRRAILAGLPLDAFLTQVLERRHGDPVTAPFGMPESSILSLMRKTSIRHLPLLDDRGKVGALAILDDLLEHEKRPLRAIIMAGGFGKRLHPLTDSLPKPMLPVGGRPLMEHIVGQLREAGVRKVHVTTHYQPEKIHEHFGDGSEFGLEMEYVSEEFPLGTAGALSLVKDFCQTHLLINGDILTDVDFRTMIGFHRENRAMVTVGVRKYDVQVPYGVVKCEGSRVMSIEEKPMLDLFVNAGIYLVEPAALAFIPSNRRFDMTDLISVLLASSQIVASFPVVEYWLDVGRHDDYERAQSDYSEGKIGKMGRPS